MSDKTDKTYTLRVTFSREVALALSEVRDTLAPNEPIERAVQIIVDEHLRRMAVTGSRPGISNLEWVLSNTIQALTRAPKVIHKDRQGAIAECIAIAKRAEEELRYLVKASKDNAEAASFKNLVQQQGGAV